MASPSALAIAVPLKAVTPCPWIGQVWRSPVRATGMPSAVTVGEQAEVIVPPWLLGSPLRATGCSAMSVQLDRWRRQLDRATAGHGDVGGVLDRDIAAIAVDDDAVRREPHIGAAAVIEGAVAARQVLETQRLAAGGNDHAVRPIARVEHEHRVAAGRRVAGKAVLGQPRHRQHLASRQADLRHLRAAGIVDERDPAGCERRENPAERAVDRASALSIREKTGPVLSLAG